MGRMIDTFTNRRSSEFCSNAGKLFISSTSGHDLTQDCLLGQDFSTELAEVNLMFSFIMEFLQIFYPILRCQQSTGGPIFHSVTFLLHKHFSLGSGGAPSTCCEGVRTLPAIALISCRCFSKPPIHCTSLVNSISIYFKITG